MCEKCENCEKWNECERERRIKEIKEDFRKSQVDSMMAMLDAMNIGYKIAHGWML